MPRVLVVGNLPTTSQIGQEVLTTRGYDEAIEKLTESAFDVIIIPAVCGTTNGHGFLQKIRDINKARKGANLPPLPILVHHSTDKVDMVVDGRSKVWNLRPSMCSFGKALFVNTNRAGWEQVLLNWVMNPCRNISQAA